MDALSAMKLVTTPPAGGLSAQAAQDLAGSGAKSMTPAELQQLGSVNSDNPLASSSSVTSGSGANFANMLGNMVNEVSQKQAEAGGAVTGLLSGQNVSLHQA